MLRQVSLQALSPQPLAAGRREGDAEKKCGPYPPRRSKQQREKRGDLEEGRGRKVDAAG